MIASNGPVIDKAKKDKEDVSILLNFVSETKIMQHHRSSHL
jgi:hypothetical protein